MSTRESGAALSQSTKLLLNQWDDARSHWRDDKSRQFHQDYLDGLPDKVTRAVAVVEELDTILKKVRQACE